MKEQQKRTAPAATGNGPTSNHETQGHSRIIPPDSLEAQAMEALGKIQAEQDKKAMAKIAKAFTKEEWHVVLRVAPAQVLAEELAMRATHGERIARRMNEVFEEENSKWK